MRGSSVRCMMSSIQTSLGRVHTFGYFSSFHYSIHNKKSPQVSTDLNGTSFQRDYEGSTRPCRVRPIRSSVLPPHPDAEIGLQARLSKSSLRLPSIKHNLILGSGASRLTVCMCRHIVGHPCDSMRVDQPLRGIYPLCAPACFR